jgi:hypothetical protein
LLLAILLLGCAADSDEEAAILMQRALASTQASLAVSGVARAPGPGVPATTVAAATAAQGPAWTPGAPRARGAAAPAAAAALVGAPADQVRRMLGDPSIRRPEGAAEVWLYEAPTCRLDVILYGEGAALVVGHAAARALGGAAGVTEAACLAAVAGAAPPPPWSMPGPRA